MKINTFPLIAVLPPLIIAAVVGISAPSFAMPQIRGQGEQVQQFRKLHDKLKLTEQQQALWARAETESHNRMKSHQGGRKQAIKEMKEALSDPQADLRALSGKMDARREMAAKESKETRELWLFFYDSLDAQQRELARAFLLERIERMEKSMERMQHMKRERHEPESLHEDMEMPQ